MNIVIRPETVQDYVAIAEVNHLAFEQWQPERNYHCEPLLVDVLRRNKLFDPELSLVAEVEGKVVAHVLFSPYEFIVEGKMVKGVVLAPIATHPEFQNAKIGAKLIEEGHKIAKAKGYEFSLLCGHPNYYPRFGYVPSAYAMNGVRIVVKPKQMWMETMSITDQLNVLESTYSERPVHANDIPWLLSLWEKMHQTDCLALHPGNSFSQWMNHSPLVLNSVIKQHGQPIGYVRYMKNDFEQIKDILYEAGALSEILEYLSWKRKQIAIRVIDQLSDAEEIYTFSVPLEMSSIEKENLSTEQFEWMQDKKAYEAFMMKPLIEKDENLEKDSKGIYQYLDLIKQSDVHMGIIVFPPVFDLD